MKWFNVPAHLCIVTEEFLSFLPLSIYYDRKITNDVIAQKLFLPDPGECYRIIRQTHWPEGVTCPHCSSKEVQKNGHTLFFPRSSSSGSGI